jgi:hypothetical protein
LGRTNLGINFEKRSRSISGLVAEYIVAIDVTRVRFPADAYLMLPLWPSFLLSFQRNKNKNLIFVFFRASKNSLFLFFFFFFFFFFFSLSLSPFPLLLHKLPKVPRGFEPRSLDSESRVLTVTPRDQLFTGNSAKQNLQFSCYYPEKPIALAAELHNIWDVQSEMPVAAMLLRVLHAVRHA